jgi:hypothetical protein
MPHLVAADQAEVGAPAVSRPEVFASFRKRFHRPAFCAPSLLLSCRTPGLARKIVSNCPVVKTKFELAKV